MSRWFVAIELILNISDSTKIAMRLYMSCRHFREMVASSILSAVPLQYCEHKCKACRLNIFRRCEHWTCQQRLMKHVFNTIKNKYHHPFVELSTQPLRIRPSGCKNLYAHPFHLKKISDTVITLTDENGDKYETRLGYLLRINRTTQMHVSFKKILTLINND